MGTQKVLHGSNTSEALKKKKRNRAGQLAKNEANQRRRRILIKALGGKCVHCGTTEFLTLDHKEEEGRQWDVKPSEIGRMARLKLYEEDYLNDKLRVLCNECNGRDGNYRRNHGVPHPDMTPIPATPNDGIPI
jgi:5-methylcytosine-specific restriction endonuclease McrA